MFVLMTQVYSDACTGMTEAVKWPRSPGWEANPRSWVEYSHFLGRTNQTCSNEQYHSEIVWRF